MVQAMMIMNDDLDYFDDLYDDLYSDVIDEEEPFESEPEEQTRPEEPSEPIEELSEPEAFEPQPSQPEKLTESEKPTEPNLSGAKELTESEYSSKPEEPTELEESTESNQHVEPRNPDESVESTGSREPSEPEPTDSYLQTLEEECVDHKPETCELAEDKLWAPNVCELVIIAQQFESLCPNPPTPCVTSDRVISAIFGENLLLVASAAPSDYGSHAPYVANLGYVEHHGPKFIGHSGPPLGYADHHAPQIPISAPGPHRYEHYDDSPKEYEHLRKEYYYKGDKKALIAYDTPIEPELYARLCKKTTTCPFSKKWKENYALRRILIKVHHWLANISK
ncbi:unnamed protein product [Cyprideis torosa]|uniref:Uncharacterized protein n=1 Tax=Cyprideis torosa TaxID=163714 RepID=A0A7R8W0V2_9CRUS|nr:unnamed protein product [Cyprideis torosa]CAG0880171.1 unnamed protein product [Cyprideis torosa]